MIKVKCWTQGHKVFHTRMSKIILKSRHFSENECFSEKKLFNFTQGVDVGILERVLGRAQCASNPSLLIREGVLMLLLGLGLSISHFKVILPTPLPSLL